MCGEASPLPAVLTQVWSGEAFDLRLTCVLYWKLVWWAAQKRRARFGTLPRLLSMESGLTWIPDHNPLLLPLAPGRWLVRGLPPVERWREPLFRRALITA